MAHGRRTGCAQACSRETCERDSHSQKGSHRVAQLAGLPERAVPRSIRPCAQISPCLTRYADWNAHIRLVLYPRAPVGPVIRVAPKRLICAGHLVLGAGGDEFGPLMASRS